MISNKYEVAQSKLDPEEWVVEFIDILGEGDGDVYMAVFSGPFAKNRANEYANHMNKTHLKDMNKSVVKDWVSHLGLRHQGVILTAIRGCDTVQKIDPIKDLARAYRERILNCFCGDPIKAKSFIERFNIVQLRDIMEAIVKSHDHYPHHYLMHLIHASEIIGYKDRQDGQFSLWLHFYNRMCSKMHMKPETEEELDVRLTMEEEAFGKAQ